MKKLLLLTLLASGLLAGPAHAEQAFTHDDEEYCQALASLTTAYAKNRIDGHSLEDIYARIRRADFGDSVTWDVRFVAQTVFKYPHLSPSQEGNLAYELCRDGY